MELGLEVAAFADKDVLVRGVARSRVRLDAGLALQGDGAVTAHAAPRGRLAPALAVAGAGLGQLSVHAGQLRLLRAVAHDGVGAACVAHLPGGRALGVGARVQRAPAAAAPLDGELAVAAAELRLAVGAARPGAVAGATVPQIGVGVVARQRLVVVAAGGTLAGLDDVLLVQADEMGALVAAAARSVRAVLPRLALAGDEDEKGDRTRKKETSHG